MYLDNLVPHSFALLTAPKAAIWKLHRPEMVSFGMLANLAVSRRRHAMENIDAIIDVGANVGQFAYMASRVWRSVPIHSCEPDPASFELLCRNAAKYGIPGVRLQGAISDSSSERRLSRYTDSTQNSLLAHTDIPGEIHTAIPVNCLTLDDWVADLPPMQNAFLKVDVQGAEMLVLRGARTALQSCKFVLLEVSFRPAYAGQSTLDQVFAIMAEDRFHAIEIVDLLRDPKRPGHPVIEADILFTREN
jgi:FkbM family methyltransferase